MKRNLAIACAVTALVIVGLKYATRCRVPFMPFIVEATARGTQIAPLSPPPELVLRMSGIPSATLYQMDSTTLWPWGGGAEGLRPDNIHVGMYTTGGYVPTEYLVACRLSGTTITQLTATPWDAGPRNGVYTVAPVAIRISGTPFVAVAWLRSLGELDSEHVRLLMIDPDPLAVREVWRNDVHSSHGGGQFIQETMWYSFTGLAGICDPVILVKKSCTGDDCGYGKRVERWAWSAPSGRFILASEDVKR